MEQFQIKLEPNSPNSSQEIEEVVNIENHLWMDEKPSSIKLEYIDNNTSTTPFWSGNYSEIKQELDASNEEHPIKDIKNVDLVAEEIVNINNQLIDTNSNNIKLDGKCSEIKQELDCSYKDYTVHYVDNATSDYSLSKLRNAIILLERLSTVQILKYTKKSDTDSEYTYRLNVDAMKYVCVYSCSKCDGTVDIKSIRHIINRPQCGCTPKLAYQCMSCNKHCASYNGMQVHVTKGLCESRKKFLDLKGFDDNEWEKLNCPKCNVSLENIAQFTKHVNDCREVPKFWCLLCDYGSTWIKSFRGHLKLHSEDLMQNEGYCKEKKFSLLKTTYCYCSTCDETLVQKGFRIPSSACIKCGTPYTYRCPKCNKEYYKPSYLRNHIVSSCNTIKNYRCSICKEKEFTNSPLLKKHMYYCGKTQYLHCKFCPYKTKYNAGMRMHSKRHNLVKDRSFIDLAGNEGPLYELLCEKCSEPIENGEYRDDRYYCLKCKTKLWLQCRKCNGMYRYRRTMTAHITSNCGLNINSERQKCPNCSLQFQNLNTHIEYCRHLINYCAHCPYSTKRRSDLIKHLLRKHQDEF